MQFSAKYAVVESEHPYLDAMEYVSDLITFPDTKAYHIHIDNKTSIQDFDYLMVFNGDPSDNLIVYYSSGHYNDGVDVVVAAPQGITGII